jgi:hypothetical protein
MKWAVFVFDSPTFQTQAVDITTCLRHPGRSHRAPAKPDPQLVISTGALSRSKTAQWRDPLFTKPADPMSQTYVSVSITNNGRALL